MARLLCVVGPHRGLLIMALEACRRLAATGHDVVLASPDDAPQPIPDGVDWRTIGPVGHAGWQAAEIAPGRAIERLLDDGFEELLEEVRPELTLIDIELHEQMVRASALCPGRVVALSPFLSVWRRAGLPPPHVLTVPGRGLGGSRAALALRWSLWRLRKAGRAARLRRSASGGPTRRLLLRRLAREVGSELRPDAAQWLMPWFYPQVPTLCLQALEFEFPHRPAPEAHYVGPMIAATPEAGAGSSFDAHPALQLLAASAAESKRRCIYATFGSFLTARMDLVHNLVRAVQCRPDWQLLLTLGGRTRTLGGESVDLGPLPENVRRFDWVPQTEVMRRVDVAVVHGGSGSTNEAVVGGAPQLVYCGHQTDMAGTTARVAYHGIGAVGSAGDSPDDIVRRLADLLDDGLIPERIRSFARLYQSYRTNQVLEQTVEALLAGRRPADRLAAAERYWQTVPRGGWSAAG